MKNLPEVFDGYAKYYDLLYRDKDYCSEAEYIIRLIRQYIPGAKNILDLGCGTGKHDIIFAKRNYDVTGVELSKKMTDIAVSNINFRADETKKLKFINADIRDIRLNEKFDVITALFHVINYQTTNDDLKAAFKTVKEHLSERGNFIFDFWYGPAVLSDLPGYREKRLEDDEFRIERTTEPVMNYNENTVDVNFKINITEIKSGAFRKIYETHKMRYLFLPEIASLLDDLGLKILHCEEWMKGIPLTEKSWYGLAVAGHK